MEKGPLPSPEDYNGDEYNAEEMNSSGRSELAVLARDNLDTLINRNYYNLPSGDV